MTTKYTKGGVSECKNQFRVCWREDKIKKLKTFMKCKYKRTDEETKQLAEEFYSTILEKHEEWKATQKPKVKKGKSYETYPFSYTKRLDHVQCSLCDSYFGKKGLWKHKQTTTHKKNVLKTSQDKIKNNS